MDYKEEFIRLYSEKISRHGSAELLEWIKRTDFFTAPASTKFHCACEHGLVMHSLSVYNTLMHDLCKAQFYKISTRNVKNEETGQWEKKPFYSVDDAFPYGHGEKSVYMIERFMRLKPAEAMAIRWHMGGFDDSVKGGSFALSLAFEKYPLAVKLHLADLESTYLREKNTSAVL